MGPALLIPVLAVFVLATLGLHLASTFIVLRRLRRAPPPLPGTLPRVSLLRPLCGLDPFDAETLGTTFALDYPNYELIFCVASPDDPVADLARRLIAAHPERGAQLLVGDDPASGNPKLNNLIKGWNAASGEYVLMTDSNVLLPPDYIEQMLGLWLPGTGLVTSPAAGQRAEGLWGALECGFLNGYQARWQLAADELGIGFAQGKNMLWRRDFLAAAGGPAVLGRDLAEDVAATKLVRGAGLRVRLAQHPFPQPIGRRKFAQVWARQLRWARVRRAGFVGLFALEILTGAVAPAAAALALVALGALNPWGFVAGFVAWYGLEWALSRVAGWPAGHRDVVGWVLRDLLLPALWCCAWAGRGFVWRGTAMTETRPEKS
ncbi:MAG: ceramide glucosyltransferase [Rhodobacteraceae bacterium]|nr:ceramide glucosyltransferase [Paracoccaceae bacterium]